MQTDPRLRETNGGRWEGRRREELLLEDPDTYRAWLAGEPVRPGGDGEGRGDVGARVMAAIDDVMERTKPGRTAVVVTHGEPLARCCRRCSTGLRTDPVLRRDAQRRVERVLENESPDHPWQVLEYNARSLPEPPAADD